MTARTFSFSASGTSATGAVWDYSHEIEGPDDGSFVDALAASISRMHQTLHREHPDGPFTITRMTLLRGVVQ